MSDTNIYEARVRVTLELDLYYEVPVPVDLSEQNTDYYIEEWCRNAYFETDISQHLHKAETVDVDLDNYNQISL